MRSVYQAKNNKFSFRTLLSYRNFQLIVIQSILEVTNAIFIVILSGLIAIFEYSFPVIAHGEGIIVEDQRGRIIQLKAPANRIITIPMPMAAVIMAIDGSSQRLIGMHPASRQAIEDGFLRRIYPEALAIPTDITRGGVFMPNLEVILGMRPDLVIQWTQPEDLISTLEMAGLTVAGLINSPPTQEINERNLTIVGELLGRSDRVKSLIEKNHRILEKVKAESSAIPMNERPKALYFRSVRESLRVVGKNAYQDYWMGLVGGLNVAYEKFAGTENAINVEQIIAWNPDIMFIGAFDDTTPSYFLDDPALACVSAIKNRRVYKLPHGGYRWDPGSHESRLTWQWAAILMHPDRFRFNLRAEIKEDYKFLYNYDLNDMDIDEILQMKLNSNMARYEFFHKK